MSFELKHPKENYNRVDLTEVVRHSTLDVCAALWYNRKLFMNVCMACNVLW